MMYSGDEFYSDEITSPLERSIPMTTDTTPRPDGLTDEHLEYLDELRESGVTNMFGASPYLVDAFSLDATTARTYLSYWMKTFSARHAGQE